MKSVSPSTFDTITNDYHNTVAVVMHAEWNLNRYYRTVVDNTPSEETDGYDIEFFPIDSITKPNRPDKSGICKAVVGQALVAQNYYSEVPSARFYTVDADDEYKYWQSPYPAAPTTFTMSDCAPQVLYVEENDVSGAPVPRQIKANKIVFTVENSFAYPVDYDVQVKYTTGGAWTTVASDIAIPATGSISLWYNGSSWTTTPDYDNLVDVHAVRLVVNSMDKEAYFNLIELGFRIHSDISSDVESWNDTFNMGEVDFITPLGTISSNTASVTLFSETDIWKNSYETGPYYKLLDKGVKFICWLDYEGDLVQEFELFSDTWDEGEDTVTVNLVDASKFFMETKPRAVLYQNITVQEAVWRVCDIVGFNKYEVTSLGDADTVIDIFWTNGEQTAWEVFSELSRGTQTAIYFDSYGVLQIKPREAAWDSTQVEQYEFNRDTVPGGTPSNIVTLDSSTKYEANKVTVNYKPTGFSEKIDNIIPFEVVWEPDGNVVLRSTPLQAAMSADFDAVDNSGKTIRLGSEGKTWPFSGIIQVEGEFISYDAKWYNHYTAAGVRTGTWVENLEQQKKLDAETGAFYRHMNSYSGSLRVKERGLYNSEAVAHSLTLSGKGWTTWRQRDYGANVAVSSPFRITTAKGGSTFKSNLTIDTGRYNSNTYHYLVRGSALDLGYRYLGTRIRIDRTAHTYKGGGMFFNAGNSLGTGYFIEVMATARMTGALRKSRNEIILYSMKADGTKKIIGGEEIRIKNKAKGNKKGSVTIKDIGAKFAVPMNSYIDLDVYFIVNSSGDHVIDVHANGRFLFRSVIDNASTWKQPWGGRFGLFARGHSSVSFDYVYGIYNATASVSNLEAFYDRIESSWVSGQWLKDWVYQTRTARRKVGRKWVKYQQRYNQRFFDEFGPMAHEVRDFAVKFTSETPVLEAKLYMSNTTQAVASDFVADVSGAKFQVGNMHRANAVINGEDSLTAGGNTINHRLLVYGRPVIQKDAQKIERTDEWGLRRRGPIEVEYESKWVQNEAEATRMADWLATHWTNTDTEVEVEVFGNPMIELTDVVHVNHEDIDDNFYVTSISNSWSAGLTTTLSLRKV